MTKIATTISELAGQVNPEDIHISTTYDNKPIQEILDGIEYAGINTNDDHDGQIHEMIDGLVDIYNSDLHEWVGKEDHGSYVSEAVESGIADTSDFERMIQAGQYQWYSEIFAEVFEWLEEALEEQLEDGVTVTSYYLEDGEPVDMEAFEQAVDEYAYGVTIEESGAGYYTLENIDLDELDDLIAADFEDDNGDAFTVNFVPEEG